MNRRRPPHVPASVPRAVRAKLKGNRRDRLRDRQFKNREPETAVPELDETPPVVPFWVWVLLGGLFGGGVGTALVNWLLR